MTSVTKRAVKRLSDKVTTQSVKTLEQAREVSAQNLQPLLHVDVVASAETLLQKLQRQVVTPAYAKLSSAYSLTRQNGQRIMVTVYHHVETLKLTYVDPVLHKAVHSSPAVAELVGVVTVHVYRPLKDNSWRVYQAAAEEFSFVLQVLSSRKLKNAPADVVLFVKKVLNQTPKDVQFFTFERKLRQLLSASGDLLLLRQQQHRLEESQTEAQEEKLPTPVETKVSSASASTISFSAPATSSFSVLATSSSTAPATSSSTSSSQVSSPRDESPVEEAKEATQTKAEVEGVEEPTKLEEQPKASTSKSSRRGRKGKTNGVNGH